MKLDVPFEKQNNNLECGPTSLSMVLKYFGENFSEEEIIESVGEVDETVQGETVGTFLVDNALFASERGFDVHVYTYSLKHLDESFVGLSQLEMKERIESYLLPECNDELDEHVLRTYVDLIDSDAKLRMKKPSLKTLENFLEREIPPILAVNARLLYDVDSLGIYSGHQIVLTGFDDDVFYWNDPDQYHPEKTLEIGRDELFFALSNNVLCSSAYLVGIEPENV
ncbi:MAG: peptidase C39 family protein [Candidatus Aenigmatarchaeota archaeon]